MDCRFAVKSDAGIKSLMNMKSGSCPSTVAAGDGASLSLSADLANLAISRKGRKKATGNVKHQGSRLGGRMVMSTTNGYSVVTGSRGTRGQMTLGGVYVSLHNDAKLISVSLEG